ncbi:hypothetical protein FHR32_007723 [Streptosporangium album]|uniref:Uncharacterized protein n=1 Tax=Streptosporangium album TaxID=47479 RepID=A0A7W7S3R7_9ACTN|nr:hypothetical protein [Streptosporangium album]
MDFVQVGGKFADRPAGEGLAEFARASGGRLDDEVLVVTAEQAGAASRSLRVQTGKSDLVESVDHIAHRVLFGLDQLGDHSHGVSAG